MDEQDRKGEGKAESKPETARQLMRQVKRRSGRRFPAEDKIRIVLEGLRGEEAVSDLCRREGVTKAAYYRWLKSFMEGGKRRLMGDLRREANSDEVKELRGEMESLKQAVAELLLENRRLKKSRLGGE